MRNKSIVHVNGVKAENFENFFFRNTATHPKTCNSFCIKKTSKLIVIGV